MTDVDRTDASVDGRVARRERNINTALDTVLEMFAEESLIPSIEQVSKRSGLSLRSLYRYFADPGELIESAIHRHRELMRDAGHLHKIGQGPLDRRIDDFAAMRLRLYERAGPVYRAAVHNAPNHPRVRDWLAVARDDLRDQFELQFALELGAVTTSDRQAGLSAGDVLFQFDTIDYLRRHRRYTIAETEAVLRSALEAILRP
ncbi:MAG: hypothetical protein OXI29_02450 [bacterium]|nr:hypothetical protein [bacterium]